MRNSNDKNNSILETLENTSEQYLQSLKGSIIQRNSLKQMKSEYNNLVDIYEINQEDYDTCQNINSQEQEQDSFNKLKNNYN